MIGDIVKLESDYTTRWGTLWPAGSEIEVEQKLRQGWQVGYKTPDERVGTQSILRQDLPPEVEKMLVETVGAV